MSSAYPPSTSTIAELIQIDISMLRLETHHRGKVLIVRTFVEPIHIQAFQNALEDEFGAVDRLALYNESPVIPPARVFAKGTVLAIKEPYYKGSADGGYIIRVDHPSNLVVLRPGHHLIPLVFALPTVDLDDSAMKWKERGNVAYLKKDYFGAVDMYTHGYEASKHDDLTLRCDLLRNRAATNLCLARYESALEDAEAAILPESVPTSGQLNAKTHGRAARAAYALRDWDKADAHFAQALLLSPDNKDFLMARMCIADRLKEVNSGIYDFKNISDSLGDKGSRLDNADFLSNTEVRLAGRRGRGLFATKMLKAGDLIFCEKAFAICFRPESMDDVLTIINLNTQRVSVGPQAMLFSDIIQDLRHSPQRAARFCDLYDGGYEPKCTVQRLDGEVVLDTFRINTIIQKNCFGCPDVRSVGEKNDEKDAMRPAGLWLQASYMNHSCDANVYRAFIGDLMIVHATRDIAKDEEIYISYSLPDADYTQMKERLNLGWGFACGCKICVAESKSSTESRVRRQRLYQEVPIFMNANVQSGSDRGSTTSITKAQQLYREINATYDPKLFTKDVPRLGLYALSAWLFQAQRTRKTVPELIKCGMLPLKDLAFAINVKGDTATFDRSAGMVSPMAVNAAVYVANGHSEMGRKRLAGQFYAFAKEMYVTLFGELRDFVELYGELKH